ncbi:MAG: hypothetical protein K0Q62_204 [Phenylobacterium sp.]|jgi:hypothetical protein|nr:hypothetical protein [Phenylobacterium sp.]
MDEAPSNPLPDFRARSAYTEGKAAFVADVLAAAR